jgi:hypothetical protein
VNAGAFVVGGGCKNHGNKIRKLEKKRNLLSSSNPHVLVVPTSFVRSL